MKLRVAIIGCGSITEFRHAPEYHANQNVEIAAFCDPVPGRAERLAAQYGGMAFTNPDDALALPDVDAVSICTSNSTHAEVTVKALRSGKHVLCEKPIATTLADAKLMILTAERCGRMLMVGHNQRFTPAHRKAKALLESGALGRVLTFRTTFSHGGPETWSADKGSGTWFFKKSSAALGALGDLGIHKADLIRWLIADDIDEVYAVAGALHKTYENGAPIDVEDNAICILKSRRGIMGTLTASWTQYGDEDNSTVLCCENGVLKIYTSPDRPLTVEWRNGAREAFDVGAMQTNATQTSTGVIDAFVKAIMTGSTPSVTGEDGFEALSIADACSQSAKCGASVHVNHYRDTGSIVSIARRAIAAGYAVQNLQMETNLIPERAAERAGERYCSETYPGFAAHRQGKSPDWYWHKKLSLELGGRRSN